MVDEDVDVPELAPKGKLLTLTTEEAIEQELAEFKVSSAQEGEKLGEVLKHYGLEDAAILSQSVNWAEQLVRWLTHPYLASLLLSLGFLGLIFEIQSPGWGVGGTVGLVCLGLFFGSHLLVNLAEWSEVLLFMAGVLLVLADLFFITGFGLLAVPGIVLMFAGVFLSLMGRSELWTWGTIGDVSRPLLLALVVTVVLAIVMVKNLPRTTTWNRLILQTEEKADAGYVASGGYGDLVGEQGVAFTPLRPGGTGLFGDRRLSVTAEGDFIEKDTPIRVTEVEGNRIVVRKSDQA
ncbi:MAG: NfeD family protein, partial [Candidatus Latescibacteria bacterium]|jgi:membrane-bound serine protease (ClpP class)|nr:NfeD family protein [Candidatus Latescibacterota bacterium]